MWGVYLRECRRVLAVLKYTNISVEWTPVDIFNSFINFDWKYRNVVNNGGGGKHISKCKSVVYISNNLFFNIYNSDSIIGKTIRIHR